MNICETFGANLRRLRGGKGLTQAELGFRSHIADLERGAKWPEQRTVEDLAAKLRCSPLEFFREVKP